MLRQNVKNHQSGYSLIELLIVVVLISIISVLVYARIYTNGKEVGGGERLLADAAARVVERRNDAVRLNSENHQMTEVQNVPPVAIDFSDLSSTATLITEGDNDGDCTDDVTGTAVTCLVSTTAGTNSWQLALRQDAMQMPDTWKIAQTASDMNGIPLIGGGTNGRGILVTKIGFDASGQAYAIESSASLPSWSNRPTGSTGGGSLPTSPFWAIYLIPNVSSPQTAVAVAVHPSGLIERFRYDGVNWLGFQNRTF